MKNQGSFKSIFTTIPTSALFMVAVVSIMLWIVTLEPVFGGMWLVFQIWVSRRFLRSVKNKFSGK